MKTKSLLVLPLLSLMLLSGVIGTLAVESSIPVKAATAQQIQTESQTTLSDLIQKITGSDKVISQAKGVLVFPHDYKGGFIFGGEYAEGVLMVDGQATDYYNLVSGSWGLQAGAQRKSVVIAFMTDEALAKFRKSQGYNLGADASATIVNMGAEGSLDLDRLNKPVLVFVLDQKGLMGGISLKGSKITKVHKK